MADTHADNHLEEAIARLQEASAQVVEGSVAPWKGLCSHEDDVTIAGAWGGYERGWRQEVERRYEWAASRFKGGHLSYELIASGGDEEWAYTFGIERGEARLAGQDEAMPLALRVTHVYRREAGAWKLVHRHADATTSTMQAVTAIAQR